MTNVTKVFIIIIVIIFNYNNVYCFEGYSGYSGGISSGFVEDKDNFEYKEVVFFTGEPILLDGIVSINKNKKGDKIESTYEYKLKNIEKSVVLTRKVTFETNISEKNNGQETTITKQIDKPKEVLVIGSTTYTLESIDFNKSALIDKRPVINYQVGNIWQRKKYSIKDSINTENSGEVTVDINSSYYGYNEYWGDTETITYKYLIQAVNNRAGETDKWGGTAEVKVSSSTSKQLIYLENQPEIISFSGGFVQRQYNNSVLEYNSSLPQFDFDGIATNKILDDYKSYTIESFPIQSRLVSTELNDIKGHWSEMDIKKLFSLEIIESNKENYKPENFTTRGEFVNRVFKGVKDVPDDPAFQNKIFAGSNSNKNEKIESPFKDVPNDHPFVGEIVGAYEKGLINGRGGGYFGINENLKFADAIVILIRGMGLESINVASTETNFKDSSDIPDYAKMAVYVAEKIGLVKGDTKGYLKPNEKLTNARSSALIVRFIEYLSEGLKKDYREGILTY